MYKTKCRHIIKPCIFSLTIRSFAGMQKPFIPNLTAKISPSIPLSSKATVKQDLRKHFQRDGYVVMKNLFSPQEVTQISDEFIAIARGRYGQFEGYVPADGKMKDGEVVARYSRIEFPHKISPNLVSCAIAHPRMLEVVTSLVGPNVKCMNSKAYIHGPGERGRVWHQDESLIPTRDKSLLCAIIAIDDHSIDSGCLMMHPGSHKSGVLFRLRQPGQNCTTEDIVTVNNQTIIDGVDSPQNLEIEAYDVSRDPEAGVSIELQAGSVIFINGYTLQRLLANSSSYVLKRALKIHYSSAETMLPWSMDGRVPLTTDNRDIIMVAGKDPYSYKGTTQLLNGKALF